MMNGQERIKWEVRKRMEEIENRLYWIGYFGRNDIVQQFRISEQQASTDIARYLKQVGEQVQYNRSSKRYEAQEDFEPLWIEPSIQEYFLWGQHITQSALHFLPTPERYDNPELLRLLTAGVHQQCSVAIEYQSMSNPVPTQRRITPHAFAHDGYRYHVRAWCHLRKDFRDFVLGRILKAEDLGEAGLKGSEDEKWNTKIIVRLGPHPELTPNQKQVIGQDYNMKNGEAHTTVRISLLRYFLTHLRLESEMAQSSRVPAAQQIVLLNPEVRGFL